MAQEEQQRCSNSSSGGGGGSSIGGGRSCKKLKQKKIPQRGLGVAQLEKIRLEELQKKDAAAAAAGSPHFIVPLPHHPPCLSDLPSPNSIFKTSVPISNLDLIGPPPVPPYACDGGGSGGGRGGHGFFPVAWNGLDADKARKLDHGFQFHPHLPEEVHPILRYSAVLQRNQQQQQPSLLASASTSPASSSGVNLQMEPPSNQSYYSNPTPLPRAEEERMVGMKRPWPFSLDNPLSGVAPFHCKLPPSAPIHDRWDESSCGWRDPCDPIKFSSGNSIFRDGSSTSFGHESPTKNIKENGSLDGEFLTLGPPISSPNLKSKQPISIPASHYGGFNLISLPGSNEDMFIRSGVPVEQQTFYSFLPVNPNGQTKSLKERKEEGSESVDLNLKLW